LTVASAFADGRDAAAAELVFEYMALTQADTGQPVPAAAGDLPAVLARECRELREVYRPPGDLFVAEYDGYLVGCAGLAVLAGAVGTAEVKRLYVRPASRGHGIARALMSRVHDHAARAGLTRLVLDVLPARTAVLGFYRRLGYTGTGPCPGSRDGLTCLEREAVKRL
jgi:GNAT superfamily N-acetyltransferase